jgi:alkanesulfonate monooxygenase
MAALQDDGGVRVFSTCPPAAQSTPEAYLRRVQDIARWSEDAGCEGILVYTDNRQIDPWLVSQVIVGATRRLCPLVAIQPVYMHPYTVAKMISSLAYLHRRRVYLNLVAGGFRNDLEALNDRTPHDERYERLAEYAGIIQRLLKGPEPVNVGGRYYQVHNLKLTPPLPPDLAPGILLSGSSDAGMLVARQLGATAVEYPKPAGEYGRAQERPGNERGIRIGIIARDKEPDAWSVAHGLFPEDRGGQLAHQIAIKGSDSYWHRQLSDLGRLRGSERNPYWLVPFENYKTFCPYLVGSYSNVAGTIASYVAAGYRTFVLDVPPSADELQHVAAVFRLATESIAA